MSVAAVLSLSFSLSLASLDPEHDVRGVHLDPGPPEVPREGDLVSPEDVGEVRERNLQVGTLVGRPACVESPGEDEITVWPHCQEQQQGQLRDGSEISDKVASPVGQGQLVTFLWRQQFRSSLKMAR